MALYWKICAVFTLALFVQVFAQQTQRRRLGGWNDVKEDNSGVQNALKFAQEEFNKNSNSADGYITQITKIIRLRNQVVAGMKYKMEVEVSLSPCNNSENEPCPDDSTKAKICTFEVLMVPWKNTKELKSSYCRER